MPYQLGDTPRCKFFKRFANFVSKQTKEEIYFEEIGRGSWTRTNECQDQNLMPYQLGDTPV